MSFREKDYIKRMIERLAELVAAVAGAKAKGEVEPAIALVAAGGEALFPGRLGTLDAVDPASAALLLTHADERRVYAGLCRLRADLFAEAGRGADAAYWRARADAIEGGR